MMREKAIEAKISRYAKGQGCLCWKLVCPSFVGVPDRMIIFPNGIIGFIEVKAEGNMPTKRQQFVIDLLKNSNVPVMWCDNVADAQKFIDELLAI